MPHRLRDLEIDEVSLVDRPANPLARIVLFKRADPAPTKEHLPTQAEPAAPMNEHLVAAALDYEIAKHDAALAALSRPEDVWALAERRADEMRRQDPSLSREQAIDRVFGANPSLQERYLRSIRGDASAALERARRRYEAERRAAELMGSRGLSHEAALEAVYNADPSLYR